MPEQHTKRISCRLQKPGGTVRRGRGVCGALDKPLLFDLDVKKLIRVDEEVVRPGCSVGDRRPPWPPRRRHWRYCDTGYAVSGSLCLYIKLMGSVFIRVEVEERGRGNGYVGIYMFLHRERSRSRTTLSWNTLSEQPDRRVTPVTHARDRNPRRVQVAKFALHEAVACNRQTLPPSHPMLML